MSVVMVVGALGAFLYLIATAERTALVAVAFIAGAAVASTLMVWMLRRWLRGGAVPWWAGIVSGALALCAVALTSATGMGGEGGALWAGLILGLLGGNIWNIRAARANRRAPSP
jgi:hypothetical protein